MLPEQSTLSLFNDQKQENYLKTEPAKLKNESGPEKAMKHLALMDKAASSISDGDLIDGLIHGYAAFVPSPA